MGTGTHDAKSPLVGHGQLPPVDDCAELELDESFLDCENCAWSSSSYEEGDDDGDALELELLELDVFDDVLPAALPLTAATPNTIAARPTPVATARDRQLRRQR
jgi:hypothetical protein